MNTKTCCYAWWEYGHRRQCGRPAFYQFHDMPQPDFVVCDEHFHVLNHQHMHAWSPLPDPFGVCIG